MSARALAGLAHAATLRHFGTPATVTPIAGVAREITAIFDAQSVDEYGVVQPRPQIRALTADVTDLDDGAAVTVDGADYVARGFRPDGRGMTTITLEAV